MSDTSRRHKKARGVSWSCSAQVDLLGFANHIALSNCDIREQVGEQAIERLSSLERALRILELEKIRYPELYPSGLQYLRINDALLLGIDAKHLSPPKGRITLTGGYNSLAELRLEAAQKDAALPQGTARESAGDVARFLGLVARIHNYINTKEAEKSLPGCRTVVASGLRKHFEDRQGRDDFFAANFSLSVAYEAQAKGSAIGLKGNCLYVEDDVAVAVSYVEECHAILASAKFLPLSFPLVDPYHYYPEMQSSVTVRSGTWNVHEPIVVPIMNQERVFRRLNPSALTNLQLFADYRRIVLNKDDRHDMIRDALSRATPTLEKINTPFGDWGDSLFPRLCFPLDMDYKKFFGRRQVRRRRNSTP